MIYYKYLTTDTGIQLEKFSGGGGGGGGDGKVSWNYIAGAMD